ncbi:MAG TPA: helix-turn-helix domain-containing protein [Ktedonobacterales bacterium]|jgi:predicted ArsR family transcriptional regulator
MVGSWDQRFLASARGRLVTLLRRDARTVDELAQRLGLTDNAVRAHLATLERDGLVRQRGVRRSGASGKPAYIYDLTPEAEQLFPRPYAATLGELLNALRDHFPPDEVEALLRASGRHLAAQSPLASDAAPRARLEAAATTLTQMGGLAEVEECDGALNIHGYRCMLAALTPTHPEVCRLAASFVSEVAGTPMRERCERGATAHCRFTPVDPVDTATPADLDDPTERPPT